MISEKQQKQQVDKENKKDILKLFRPETYFNMTRCGDLEGQQAIKQYYGSFMCTVCYDIPLKPVRCKKCRQVYCLDCVTNQKKVKNTCAFRCKGDFIIERCKQFSPSFICPYSQACNCLINSQKQFQDHLLECQYASIEQRKQINNRKFYKCIKSDHPLEFYIATYVQMMMSNTCALCQSKDVLCRSYCRVCKQKYCLNCRPVPVSKSSCPIGHELIKKHIAGLSYYCDVCSLPSIVVGPDVYDDPMCNFGLCVMCYEQLPEQRNQNIIIIANQPQFCKNTFIQSADRQQHRIVLIQEKIKASQCSLCGKIKYCPQKCMKCSISYCLKCKPFLAYSNFMCKKKHFIQSNTVLPQTSPCYSCERVFPKVSKRYIDEFCKISLCQECLEYGINIMLERLRFKKPHYCKNKHNLNFHSSIQEYFKACGNCQKFSPIKFYCNLCYENRFYCCSCQPINNETLPQKKQCYLSHQLLPTSQAQLQQLLKIYQQYNPGYKNLLCHFCCRQIIKDTVYRCNLCNLNACSSCFNNQQSSEEQEQMIQIERPSESSQSEFQNLGY